MRILLAEDNATSLALLKRQLEKAGHTVDAVSSGHQAFLRAGSRQVDLLITDIRMPGWDGYKCIEALTIVAPTLPVIVHSSLQEDEIRRDLPERNSVLAIVSKEEDPAELLRLVNSDLPRHHSRSQVLARIVCTIGPSCRDRDTIGRMMLAGMDVARLNFSHGSHDDHDHHLRELRAAERKWGKPLAILQDLCGPKLRCGDMEQGGVELKNGADLRVLAEAVVGNSERISTNTPELLADLQPGDPVLLDDGLLELEVLEASAEEARCRVIQGGLLKSHKGMNLPETSLSLPSVTEKDRRDMEWAARNDVDFVAISFVRHPDDVRQVRDTLRENGSQAQVIAKVEKPEAVELIDEVIAEADGIMIARGDMGVELDASRVPWIQRDILERCARVGKPVITATQMLESMTHNPRPTRAEVTDVTVAIREGSDALMLSGETAVGEDPVRVVKTMRRIISESESHAGSGPVVPLENAESWQHSLFAALRSPECKVTMVIDSQGELLPTLSKQNRQGRLVLVTESLAIARRSKLYHGVTPVILPGGRGFVASLEAALAEMRGNGTVECGDLVAVVEAAPSASMPYRQLGSLVFLRA